MPRRTPFVVYVWDAATGKKVRSVEIKLPQSGEKPKTDVKVSNDAASISPANAIAPDGKLLAHHSFEGIFLYELQNGREVRRPCRVRRG